jgi:hypothetical protein
MSDSGRTLGDCTHGRLEGYCVPCLRENLHSYEERIEILESERDLDKAIIDTMKSELERFRMLAERYGLDVTYT